MKKRNIIYRFLIFICFFFVFFSINACGGDDKKGNDDKIKCTYDGHTIRWNKVNKAEKYKLVINETNKAKKNVRYANNDEATVEEVEVSANELEYEFEKDSASVDIIAVDKKGDEIISKTFEFTSVGCFETPIYKFGTISWTENTSAVDYLVKVDGIKYSTNNETSFQLNPGINNNVQVKPILDVTKVKDGRYYTYSVPVSYDILQSPVVSNFDKTTNTISWNTVPNAGGYYLEVELEDKVVFTQSGIGGQTTYFDGYSFSEAGEYTVKLAARENANANSKDSIMTELKITRLDTPENIVVEDIDGAIVLKWDKVKDADKYRIMLPDGNFAETRDLYYKYIPEARNNETSHNFKIYSASDNKYVLDSIEFSEVSVVKLGTVENIKIQGEMITWDMVDKAQGYIVCVDGTENHVDSNEFHFDGYTGSHEIKIKACGNGNLIVSSEYSVTKEIYKLSSPTNLTIYNGVLSWDPVKNAIAYKVIMANGVSDSNNGSTNVTTNTYLLNETDLLESKTIQVQAIGNGDNIADSAPSAPYNIYVLEAPVVSVNEVGLAWSKVENATSYTVKIGDYKFNVTGTALNVSELDVKPDVYSVVVQANGNQSRYFDSKNSNVISMKLLTAPTLKQVETGIEWKTVTSAFDYEVRIDDGEIISVGATARLYEPKFNTSGIHTISVRAVGDGVSTVTSAWTTIQIDVKQVSAPTNFSVTREGKMLIVTTPEIDQATGYNFKIGGVVHPSNTNTFELEINNPGNYAISVNAQGNGFTYIDSAYCKEKVITLLSSVENLDLVKQDDTLYTIEWNPVNDVVSYTVIIEKTFNDGETQILTLNNITACEIELDVTETSSVLVTIIAKGNNKTIFDSEPIEKYHVFK